MNCAVLPSKPNPPYGTIRPVSVRTYLFTIMFSGIASMGFMLSSSPSVHVDGQHLISDVAPVTSARGTFLPLRAISLGVGAVTSYDHKTGDIEVMRGRDTIKLHVGERKGTLNGMTFTMRHPPFLVRGRVMVPSGLFEKALSSSVHFDTTHQNIDITSGH